MNSQIRNKGLLHENAGIIENLLCSYMGYESTYRSNDFVTSLSHDFLEDVCPSALGLPGALIVQEELDQCLISIHLRKDIYDALDSTSLDRTMLDTTDGFSAFLILTEEISHFHHYTRHAESQTPLSRLEMEIQAELEKIIVASLIFRKIFGRSHVLHLTKKIFDESVFTGVLTDYRHASKTVEKFWKQHLNTLGEDLVFNSGFRRLIQEISRKTGQQKKRLLMGDVTQFAA